MCAFATKEVLLSLSTVSRGVTIEAQRYLYANANFELSLQADEPKLGLLGLIESHYRPFPKFTTWHRSIKNKPHYAALVKSLRLYVTDSAIMAGAHTVLTFRLALADALHYIPNLKSFEIRYNSSPYIVFLHQDMFENVPFKLHRLAGDVFFFKEKGGIREIPVQGRQTHMDRAALWKFLANHPDIRDWDMGARRTFTGLPTMPKDTLRNLEILHMPDTYPYPNRDVWDTSLVFQNTKIKRLEWPTSFPKSGHRFDLDGHAALVFSKYKITHLNLRLDVTYSERSLSSISQTQVLARSFPHLQYLHYHDLDPNKKVYNLWLIFTVAG